MKNQNEKILATLATKSPAKRLSNALNQLMIEHNIDGVLLSKNVGIPTTTINRLRKGDPTNNPTLTTLVPLAEFFSITVSQLIGDEPLPKSSSRHHPEIPLSLTYLPLLSWGEVIGWPSTINQKHSIIST